MTVIYCNADLSTGSDDGTSEANAWKTVQQGITAINGAAAGSILYIKRTSSRIDESNVTITGAGDDDNYTTIEGYTTTPGDNGMFEYGGGYWEIDGDYVSIKNIDIEFAATDNNVGVLRFDSGTEKGHLHNCKIYNTSTGSNDIAVKLNSAAVITNCEIISDGAITTAQRGAIYLNNFDGAVVSGCVIRGLRGFGGLPAFHSVCIEGNIFCHAPNVQMVVGIDLDLMSGTSQVNECIVANNTILTDDIGINFKEIHSATKAACILVKNNLIYGDGGGIGIQNEDADSSVGVSIIGNAIGNMGGSSNHISGFDATNSTYDNIDLTADPFVDKANLDFRLNGVAGGGAACRASASPTTFKNMSFTNRRSIGAVGHDGLVERVSVG
tara:strand:+ start:45 stop:1193 length:1149 start_codon:yes stop_codon:yes gene_type:complete